jgi:hypothetical protein
LKRTRPLFVALLLLAVLDLALRSPVYPWFPDDFRFPRTSTMGYERYLEFMEGHDTARIAVVGDSIVQGIAVERDGTLPAQWDALYEEEERGVDVFNFGISAAHAEDLYPVVATIANRGAADLIVFYFDYPFYGDSEKVYAGRYPELWDADTVGSFAPAEGDPLVDPTRAEAEEVTLDERIGRAVASFWRLYEERDTINAVLLDGTPSSWLKHHVNYQYGAFRWIPQWIKLPLDQFDEASLREMWKTSRLTPDNVQLSYLRLAVEKARHEEIPFVLLWGPINEEVARAYDLVDPDDYAANREAVRLLVEENDGTFVDLATGFPPGLLADSVHPFAEGYGWMAERLSAELAAQVDALEAARRAEAGAP